MIPLQSHTLSLSMVLEPLLIHQLSRDLKAGRQAGRQTARQNKPHFLQAKQWPKSIREINRRNIPLSLYLSKIKMMIFGGTSLSQQCSCTWMMLGWGPGNVKFGNKRDKCCLGSTFPSSSPLGEAQNTPSSWHHPPELHNWFVCWSLGSCTNCWVFFIKENFSQRWNAAEISHGKWKSSRKKVWEVVKGQQNWNCPCTQLGGYNRYSWQHLERHFINPAQSKIYLFFNI